MFKAVRGLTPMYIMIDNIVIVLVIGHRWIPTQRPVTQSFDVFFDLRLN